MVTHKTRHASVFKTAVKVVRKEVGVSISSYFAPVRAVVRDAKTFVNRNSVVASHNTENAVLLVRKRKLAQRAAHNSDLEEPHRL